MTTIRRRQRVQQTQLSPYKAQELLNGRINPVNGRSYDGYSVRPFTDGAEIAPFISEQMRQDWFDHREELLEFWDTGGGLWPGSPPWMHGVDPDPDRRPWAAEQFEP